MNSYPCCKHCPSVDHPGSNEHIEACFYGCDGFIPESAKNYPDYTE